MSRRQDYYTRTFRSEQSLAATALDLRTIGKIRNVGYFDIVEFFSNSLYGREFKGKGILDLDFLRSNSDDYPAIVTYRPVTLHIDSEVWQLAKIGEPDSRHIVAHEIGHISLHDHDAKAFSNDPSANIKFARDEYSTEWQANTFAAHFLLPDHLVRAFSDPMSLAHECSVPQKLAEERFSSVNRSKRKICTGEACPTCNNFTLVRIGLNQKCETCGMIKDDATF